VIDYLDDALPTCMRPVVGEVAEVFTTRKIKKEWPSEKEKII